MSTAHSQQSAKHRLCCRMFLTLVLCSTAIGSPAQTLTTLVSFEQTSNGLSPVPSPTQGTDGNFYGVTPYGGSGSGLCTGSGCGTVFRMTSTGVLTTLYSFCSQSSCPDGGVPYSPLVQAADGNFYGTTVFGGTGGNDNGSNFAGTIFRITPSGTLTTLYSFCSSSNCTDGAEPAGLVQSADGSFYGTTLRRNGPPYNEGTVFEVTYQGVLRTLYSFCSQSNCADGAVPRAALSHGIDGNFYGTTFAGGSNGSCDVLNGGCGTSIQNHSGRHADYTVQLLLSTELCRRCQSWRNPGPGL